MTTFTAAVLGGSGQVGGSVIKALLEQERCTGIILFNRRKLDDYEDEPRVKQHIIDMDIIGRRAVTLLQLDSVGICFVTMGVGSPGSVTREELEKVDLEIPTAFAQAAKAAGCVRHISLLSCTGADAEAKPSNITGTASSGGLYLSIKGKVEQEIENAGLQSVAIFRPATLIGNDNTPGWAAMISKSVSWALPWRFKEVHIDDLGRAMVKVAISTFITGGPESTRYEGESLSKLL